MNNFDLHAFVSNISMKSKSVIFVLLCLGAIVLYLIVNAHRSNGANNQPKGHVLIDHEIENLILPEKKTSNFATSIPIANKPKYGVVYISSAMIDTLNFRTYFSPLTPVDSGISFGFENEPSKYFVFSNLDSCFDMTILIKNECHKESISICFQNPQYKMRISFSKRFATRSPSKYFIQTMNDSVKISYWLETRNNIPISETSAPHFRLCRGIGG